MEFVKMHGLGNDFVMLGHEQARDRDLPDLARRMCDRHFGAGADGLIAVLPADNADFTMRIFNPDGSEPEMCGNGVRCAVKFYLEHGPGRGSNPDTVTVNTLAGLRPVTIVRRGGETAYTVNMGAPVFEADKVPVTADADRALEYPLPIGNTLIKVTCVSMGNPHCVVFVDQDLTDTEFRMLGPQLSTHEAFPRQTNVEFVTVLGRSELRMRVWERGAGETLACGTGACATLAAAHITGRADREATVHLPGGDLNIQWLENGPILMTGPAQTAYTGVWAG